MSEYYDVTESLLSSKANEEILAFAGFSVPATADRAAAEGLLKIAANAHHEARGSDYLTLTFVLDLEGDEHRRAAWRARFRSADQEALAAALGADFDLLLEVPLNSFAASDQFFIEELNLYFKRLAGRERELIEERLIPALATLLGFAFDPIDWIADRPEGDPALAVRPRRWLAAG